MTTLNQGAQLVSKPTLMFYIYKSRNPPFCNFSRV